jgi:hypothetical protein
MSNTADVIGGKPIAVWLESILGGMLFILWSPFSTSMEEREVARVGRGAILLFCPGHHTRQTNIYLHKYILLTLDPWRGSRGVPDSCYYFVLSWTPMISTRSNIYFMLKFLWLKINWSHLRDFYSTYVSDCTKDQIKTIIYLETNIEYQLIILLICRYQDWFLA